MSKHGLTSILSRRMIGSAAVLACCLCLNFLPTLAAPGSWTLKAPMPMALAVHASCAVDGILYVVGGDDSHQAQLRTLFAYDPKTDSWTRKKDMPTERHWLAACAVDGIIYAIGGGGLNEPVTGAVEAYDPKTDTWVPKAELPTPRWTLAACAVDGIIYAIGGSLSTAVEAYDPKTDQWTTKADLPEWAGCRGADVVNGLIYVFFADKTFAYNPTNDNWSTLASVTAWSLVSVRQSAPGAVDGLLYLFGGFTDSQFGYDLSLSYDPVQNQFAAKRKMPAPCATAACATIDGKVYLTGGVDKSPVVYPDAVVYDTLWVFDPQGGVTPQLVGLTIDSTNSVRLAWQGEAGRLYGVEATRDPVGGSWTRVPLSTGWTILATNALVEVTGTVPSPGTNQFFRVFEAN